MTDGYNFWANSLLGQDAGAATMQWDQMAVLAAAPFIGSFAETAARRLPAGRPVVVSRSHCEGCGTTLAPIDLMPMLSWSLLRGRCRHCSCSIPFTHPAAELTAVALTIWAIASVPHALVYPTVILAWALLTLALMDIYHLVLADAIVVPLGLVGLATSFALSRDVGIASLIGVAVTGGAAWGIRWLYRVLRGREGLGLGDVKLLAAAGAWVSWQGMPSVILIAAASAILVAATVAALRGGQFAKRRIAFGAFIAIGLWVVWLYGPIQVGF